MEEVKDSLKILIQGESDAVATYNAFSKKADEEGYKNIATLFKALVAAERIHIKNHRNALGEVFEPKPLGDIDISSTIDNIKNAIDGESEEARKLYPKLLKTIKKHCNEEYGKVARLSMSWAKSVEKEHAKLLKLAYKSLQNGKDIQFDIISVCQVCGNVVLNDLNKKECKICGHDEIFFTPVTLEV